MLFSLIGKLYALQDRMKKKFNRKDFRPLVCGWHDTRKHWAEAIPRHSVSHGICDLCFNKMLREIGHKKTKVS